MEFLPVNNEQAKQFEEKLSKNMLYRSTDNFIAIYNSNLINKSNEEIDKVAKAVVEIYKNVALVNRQFIVKDPEEVIADEFGVLFPHIAFVATLKRIAKDVFSANYPEDTKLVFLESDKNVVFIFEDEMENPIPFEGAERLRDVSKSIATNPFLINNLEFEGWGEEGEDEGISFKAQDVLKLDTSFITEIGELLNTYINQ